MMFFAPEERAGCEQGSLKEIQESSIAGWRREVEVSMDGNVSGAAYRRGRTPEALKAAEMRNSGIEGMAWIGEDCGSMKPPVLRKVEFAGM